MFNVWLGCALRQLAAQKNYCIGKLSLEIFYRKTLYLDIFKILVF